MRNTSAPASNSRLMTARSEDAGPSVATIFVRRCRRIDCSLRALGSWRDGSGRCACRGAGGQRVTRRLRLLRLLLGGFGQLYGPGALLGGIDLEEAGAVIAMR